MKIFAEHKFLDFEKAFQGAGGIHKNIIRDLLVNTIIIYSSRHKLFAYKRRNFSSFKRAKDGLFPMKI